MALVKFKLKFSVVNVLDRPCAELSKIANTIIMDGIILCENATIVMRK